MEFTELDNLAWDLFPKDGLTKNKNFFVHWQLHWPYSKYYEKAKLELRKQKLEKICSKLEIK